MIIGYARVSTQAQDLAIQLAELQVAGCARIYCEKISGKDAQRPELKALLSHIMRDDTVIVTRLDRLARSTRDLLNIIDNIAKAGAGFRSLKDSWADTTTPHGRLMLTILGGLAEFERELIRARTGEGRKRAQERGVIFGRKPKLDILSQAIIRETTSSQRALAATYDVHYTTIGRIRNKGKKS